MAEAVAEAPEGRQPREKGSHRIQVSSAKKPMFFYVNLAKRLLGEHEEVHLSALGMAVSTMVSIVEILKKDGLAVETRLSTTMELLGEERQRPVQKAKMEIVVKKTLQFHEIIAAEKAADEDSKEQAAEDEDDS